MTSLSGAIVGTIAFVCLPAALSAQEPPAAPAPTVRDIRLTGVHELSADAVTEAARVAVGQPLPVPPDRVDDLGARLVRHYRDEGYTFAEVKSAFDTASGVLSFDVDEGVIGAVEFTGVD